MKVKNMRVRVNSIWRDIKDWDCAKDSINMIANNEDKFEFNKNDDLNDVAVVISMSDLLELINGVSVEIPIAKIKKMTKKKEAITETTNETDDKAED